MTQSVAATAVTCERREHAFQPLRNPGADTLRLATAAGPAGHCPLVFTGSAARQRDVATPQETGPAPASRIARLALVGDFTVGLTFL